MNLKLLFCASGLMLVRCDYWAERKELIDAEESLSLGATLNLTEKEKYVNEILMEMKMREYDDATHSRSAFLPSMHFFQSKRLIRQSRIYKFIQKIPKGASLHEHENALVSSFALHNFTFKEDLYGCIKDYEGLKLRFFNKSGVDKDPSCLWLLLKDFRKEDPNFDRYLKKQLTLVVDDPAKAYPTAKDVWKKVDRIFNTIRDLIDFEPVTREYIYEALKELHDDNVKYLEFRGAHSVYDLTGKKYTVEEVVGIYKEVVEAFIKDHPDFTGARMIYTAPRQIDPKEVEEELKKAKQLMETSGDFVAGFDFAGQEDLGKPLVAFEHQIEKFAGDMKFFFHAGETEWLGTATDLNLVDAVLLNSSRIGHAFGISKHPKILQLVKEKDIAIEICPISNQVMKLVDDLRDHPASHLIAEGYPVVIGSGQPSLWGAKGLSFDWYIAFMGLSSRKADLRMLKQLALNSLKYSAMNEAQKKNATDMWTEDWEIFLDEMLAFQR